MFRVTFRRNRKISNVNDFYCNYIKDVKNVCLRMINMNYDFEDETTLIKTVKNFCNYDETLKLFKNFKLSPSKNLYIVKMFYLNEYSIPIVLEKGEFKTYSKHVSIDLSFCYKGLNIEIFKPAWISDIEKIFVYIYEDYKNDVLRIEICIFYDSYLEKLKYSASIDPGIKNIITLLTTENDVVYVKCNWYNLVNGRFDVERISNSFVKLIKKLGVRYLFIGDKTLKISSFMCGKFLKWSDWDKIYYHSLINKIMELCRKKNIFISFIDESYSSTFRIPINIVGLKDKDNMLKNVINKEKIVKVKINNKEVSIPRDVYSCCFLLHQVGNYFPENIDKMREFIIN